MPVQVGVVAAIDEVVRQWLGQVLWTELPRGSGVVLRPVLDELAQVEGFLILGELRQLSLHLPDEPFEFSP